jgi:hypothetical protein
MVNNNLKNLNCSFITSAFLLLLVCLWCAPAHAQTSAPDTFKLANKYIAKKKYHRASKYLSSYHKQHPKDLNSIWLDAQAKLYANNYKQSDELYKGALKIAPKNDYVRLNYIHSLLDMGKNETAGSLLNSMDKDGKSYSDMSFLYAQLYFWEGNYTQASAYMKKALQDTTKKEWNKLNDQLELARAPKISLNTSYITDNQPLTVVTSSLKFENYFSRLLNVYVNCDEYHFMQDKVSDALWLTAGDKLFFPKTGTQLNLGVGVFNFPVKNQVGASVHLGVTQKLSQQFDLEGVVDRVPYLDTKTSIDTNITATKLAGMLNWHRRGWKAQAAVISSMFDNNVSTYSAYAWVLAPVATFRNGQLSIGYSTSYSNSNVNSYAAVNSLGDILATYSSGQAINGVYTPYFTPDNLIVNAALVSLSLNLDKNVSLVINGDVGYGSINNPYLFLDKNSAGSVFINKGYAVENFVPGDASAVLNYHIDKTWLLQAKYVYRTTYFFTSNYIGVGVQKSFLHEDRRSRAHSGGSAFMRKIQEIQDRIQNLYAVNNAGELISSVGKIKGEITALRDQQKMKQNTSEKVLPNSEKAAQLQERYDGLNDMLNDINSVSLDDDKDNSVSPREWLVDKLYELTSISYNGDLQD